jgi:hypothetical protein
MEIKKRNKLILILFFVLGVISIYFCVLVRGNLVHHPEEYKKNSSSVIFAPTPQAVDIMDFQFHFFISLLFYGLLFLFISVYYLNRAKDDYRKLSSTFLIFMFCLPFLVFFIINFLLDLN